MYDLLHLFFCLCLLRNLSFSKYGKEGKRMEWELEIKDSGYLPE
jgi:hypothetical protein